MALLGSALQPLELPDVRLLFLVNLAAVLTVTIFASVVIGLVLRRRYLHSLEQQKMAVVGTTTARILHQIKNPVQSLLLQSELLTEFEREGDHAQRGEATAAIVGEAMRLAAMLNELSTWTSGGQRRFARKPLPLHEMLQAMTTQERREAEQRGVALELELGAECEVEADAYYLRQAVENLVRNARDALEGRPDARIRIDLARTGRRAVVRVADNGPGIEAAELKRIFEPFVSTKSAGMGLGLPIAREIVERHDGELTAESRPGGGSVFTIRLPLYTGGGRAAAAPRGAAGAEEA